MTVIPEENLRNIIVLEGVDGVGKSTVAKLLVDKFNNGGPMEAVYACPSSTAAGAQARKILLEPGHKLNAMSQIMLVMAAHIEMLEHVVRPALAEGKVVVLDRYLISTLVYQGIEGASADNMCALHEYVLHRAGFGKEIIFPALTYRLRAPAEVLLQRQQQSEVSRTNDRYEGRDVEFYRKLDEEFEAAGRTYYRHAKDNKVEATTVLVDANVKSAEEIASYIYRDCFRLRQ